MSFSNLTDGNAVVGYMATGTVHGWDAGDVSPVPEPSTPLLLGIGLAALALGRSRAGRGPAAEAG